MDNNLKNKLKYCNSVINNSNDKDQLLLIERILLNSLNDNTDDNDCIYRILIRLYFSQQRYDEVKKIYVKMKYVSATTYYKLFQIAIKENRIDLARNYLKKYKEELIRTNHKFNIAGYDILLNKLNGEDIKFENENNNYIITNHIKDEKLLDCYNKYIELIKEDKYIEAISKLNECKELANNSEIRVNFGTYIELTNIVKDYKLNEFASAIENKDNIYDNKYIVKLYKLACNNYNLEKMLIICNKLIDLGKINESKLIIEKLKEYKTVYLCEEEIKYLENKIREKERYSELKKEDLEKIEKVKALAKKLYEKDKFIEAIDYYQALIYLYNLNEFNYYIGKMYYKMGIVLQANNYNCKDCYMESLKYLEKYLEKGTEKYNKAVLYIVNIKKRLNIQTKKTNKLLDSAKKVAVLEKFNFTLDNLYVKRNDEIDYYDTKPKHIIKSIKMNINDFKKQD